MEERRQRLALAALAACSTIACRAEAQVEFIFNTALFDTIPHTFIDFETRGDGTTWNFVPGESFVLPANEYGALGLTVPTSNPGVILNDPTQAVDEAQAIVGSPEHLLTWLARDSPAIGPAVLFFQADFPDVHAVGFGMLSARIIHSLPDARIDVFARNGLTLLDSIAFRELVDGFTTDETQTIEFGDMTIVSEQAIGSIRFENFEFTGVDDLRFSTVPAPGAWLPLLVAGGVTGVQRRRR